MSPSGAPSHQTKDIYVFSTYYHSESFASTLGLWMNSTATKNDLFMCNNDHVSLYDGANYPHSVVAGGGPSGQPLDGTPATSGVFSRASAVVGDGSGNLYMTIAHNEIVRKVDSHGIISTVAGIIGQVGFDNPDGGAATSYGMNYPTGIALDKDGNVYFAGAGGLYAFLNIRKVNAESGIINTVVEYSSSGDRGDGGHFTSATIATVYSLYVFDDKLYFSTSNNHVRLVDFATGKDYCF